MGVAPRCEIRQAQTDGQGIVTVNIEILQIGSVFWYVENAPQDIEMRRVGFPCCPLQ